VVVSSCIHIAAFALSIGTIALVDLRMLGLAFHSQSSSSLAKMLAPWTLMALAVIAAIIYHYKLHR
jgi:hypothetical protein